MEKNFIKECMLDKNNMIICVISSSSENAYPLLIYVSKTAEINAMIGQRYVNDDIEGIKL